MYKLLKTCGRAKRGEFHTPHGVIQTPVFMNVGTLAAIKGALSTEDLEQIKCQVELSNTYHLHLRPGDKVVKQLGGLHKFPISMEEKYLWALRRVCRFNQTSLLPLLWRLMNVSVSLQNGLMWKHP